jgi:hypothetical protein
LKAKLAAGGTAPTGVGKTAESESESEEEETTGKKGKNKNAQKKPEAQLIFQVGYLLRQLKL